MIENTHQWPLSIQLQPLEKWAEWQAVHGSTENVEIILKTFCSNKVIGFMFIMMKWQVTYHRVVVVRMTQYVVENNNKHVLTSLTSTCDNVMYLFWLLSMWRYFPVGFTSWCLQTLRGDHNSVMCSTLTTRCINERDNLPHYSQHYGLLHTSTLGLCHHHHRVHVDSCTTCLNTQQVTATWY